MAAPYKQLGLILGTIFVIALFADCSAAWAKDIRSRLKPPSKDKKYNVEVGPVKIKPTAKGPKGNVKKNYVIQTGPIKKIGPAPDKKIEAQTGPSEKMQEEKPPERKVDIKINSIKPIDDEDAKKTQAPNPKIEIIDVKAWKIDKEGKKTDEQVPIKVINKEMQPPSDVDK